MPTRPCPICNRTLAVVARDGVTLYRCEPHGVWVDHHGCERLTRRAGQAGQNAQIRAAEARGGRAAWLGLVGRPVQGARRGRGPEPVEESAGHPAESPRHCPDCGVEMTVERREDIWRQSPTVVVDVCEKHGLWLDRGELPLLLERARRDAERVSGFKAKKRFDEAYERGQSGRNDAAGIAGTIILAAFSDL